MNKDALNVHNALSEIEEEDEVNNVFHGVIYEEKCQKS